MRTTGKTAVLAAAVVMVSTPRAAAAGNGSQASPVPVGPTQAYSVTISHGASCSIHPEGITNDPSRNVTLVARDDGKIRFDIVPSAAAAWGTRLTVDCVLSNASQSHLVDLNDPSTFKSEAGTDLQPVKTGVRPPLTGDLTAIPMNQLLQGHYPMRPDVSSPFYAKWVQQVTTSADIFRAVPVAALGLYNTGSFVTGTTQPDQNWSGFVQAAAGFTVNNGYPYANPSLSLSDVYGGYKALTLVPNGQGCWQAGNCDESSFWAGVGGGYLWGGTAGNSAKTSLLQNGFAWFFGQDLELFYEFWPGPVFTFQSVAQYPLNVGDEILLEGYDGDANCNYTTSAPTNGCFAWFNFSEPGGWVQWDYAPWVQTNPMTGESAQWFPATAEYISEWHPGGGINDNITGEVMEGTALDLAGNWHPDPGSSSATDPYAVFWGQDNNRRLCNIVEWANSTVNSPQDPMYFSPLQCGPN